MYQLWTSRCIFFFFFRFFFVILSKKLLKPCLKKTLQVIRPTFSRLAKTLSLQCSYSLAGKKNFFVILLEIFKISVVFSTKYCKLWKNIHVLFYFANKGRFYFANKVCTFARTLFFHFLLLNSFLFFRIILHFFCILL